MSLTKIILWSSVGRKFVLALTGLALFLFVVVHLLGNLTLFLHDGSIFNKYAHTLQSMGGLLYIAEALLASLFLIHAIYATAVTLENRKARTTRYYKEGNAGKPSRKGFSSKTMIYTGALVLTFIIIHIKTLKYGPHYDGKGMRDLHKLISETFHNIWYVTGYGVAMIIFGFHLRHAFLSAFQTLGIENPRYTPALATLALLLSVVLAGGFLSIPVWVYFH